MGGGEKESMCPDLPEQNMIGGEVLGSGEKERGLKRGRCKPDRRKGNAIKIVRSRGSGPRPQIIGPNACKPEKEESHCRTCGTTSLGYGKGMKDHWGTGEYWGTGVEEREGLLAGEKNKSQGGLINRPSSTQRREKWGP